jgi:hypothetical protein
LEQELFIGKRGNNMAPQKNIAVAVFIILSLVSIFFFVNSPIESVKQNALLVILMFATLTPIVLTNKEVSDYFQITSFKNFVEYGCIGVIWGILSIVVASVLIKSLNAVYNLFGTISAVNASTYSAEQIFFTAISFPISETVLLVASVLAIVVFAPKIRLDEWLILLIVAVLAFFANADFLVVIGLLLVASFFFFTKIKITKLNINATLVIAFLLITLVFSFLHYNSRGKEQFEYSIGGLLNFSLNTSGFGSSTYVGALPQLILGSIWLISALVYKNFIVPMVAHIAQNTFALYTILGLNSVLVFIFLILGLLLIFGILRTDALKTLVKLDLDEFYV